MLAINVQITPEQRLEKAVVSIMANKRYVAMAGILMLGKREVVYKPLPFTACTNGRDEMYGADFIENLSDAELRGLILHECKHKMYRHLTTWKHLHEKDAQCANMACDYVINLEVVDENPDGFAVLPEGGLLDERFRNMNAKEVFDIIYEEQQGGSGQGEGEGEGGETLDSHDWEGAQEMSDAEKRELEKEVDQAIRQGALTAGKVGAGVPLGMQKALEPEIDWRDPMRDFFVSTCSGKEYSTYNRPNRRFMAAGKYMPSGVSERVGEIVIACDASGSMYGKRMQTAIGAIKVLSEQLNIEKVHVLYWDGVVGAHETYTGDEFKNFHLQTKSVGGGGTNVNCVCNYIREHNMNPEAVVVLTDGELYGGWGTWAHPVLWCITGNDKARPTVGKYIHVTV